MRNISEYNPPSYLLAEIAKLRRNYFTIIEKIMAWRSGASQNVNEYMELTGEGETLQREINSLLAEIETPRDEAGALLK